MLELVFRFVIPAADRPDNFFDSEYAMVKYDPEAGEEGYSIGAMAGQQERWRINNHGWNDEQDYRPKGDFAPHRCYWRFLCRRISGGCR